MRSLHCSGVYKQLKTIIIWKLFPKIQNQRVLEFGYNKSSYFHKQQQPQHQNIQNCKIVPCKFIHQTCLLTYVCLYIMSTMCLEYRREEQIGRNSAYLRACKILYHAHLFHKFPFNENIYIYKTLRKHYYQVTDAILFHIWMITFSL